MKEVKLSQICYLINKGKAVIKNNTGNIYMVGFTNIENGNINIKETSKCKLTNEYMDLKMYDIENLDIILPPITRKNLVIKQLDKLDEASSYNMIYSSRAVYLRVNSCEYIPEFLYHLLSTEKYKRKLLEDVYTSGSYIGTYQISIERLKNFKIPKVSIDKQRRILQKEKEINSAIQDLKKNLSSLYECF